jgi:hypothetical protein
MTHDRGLRLQNAWATWLRAWWPLADSAGAGRGGTDVTNTPGVAWEVKTADKFSPLEFVRQAKSHAKRNGAVPITVYFPRGSGAGAVENVLMILPALEGMRLLEEAGYTALEPLTGGLSRVTN